MCSFKLYSNSKYSIWLQFSLLKFVRQRPTGETFPLLFTAHIRTHRYIYIYRIVCECIASKGSRVIALLHSIPYSQLEKPLLYNLQCYSVIFFFYLSCPFRSTILVTHTQFSRLFSLSIFGYRFPILQRNVKWFARSLSSSLSLAFYLYVKLPKNPFDLLIIDRNVNVSVESAKCFLNQTENKPNGSTV